MRYASYRSRYIPASHPLARGAAGSVGEHRVVLFEKIGPGSHPCAWCGTPVAWFPKTGEKRLETDHVDNDGLNNDPANLEPSCSACNGRRGRSYWACRALGVEWTGSAEQTNFAVDLLWLRYEEQFGAGSSAPFRGLVAA